MQSRVVGWMESWRGGVRRVGRETRGWFAAAWRPGTGSGGTGVIQAESGSGPVMTDDGVTKERIARGAAVRALDRAGERDRERADAPDRQVTVPEQNRIPSWLQTGAAWSWRLLLLAIAI